MFKSWRNDKNKIKAVFKLQFQATQVPRLKKSAVMISLVPEDVGKPTFKLEKVAVQDGTCLWENPIFVTVKLIREPKTGKLNEKIYHFIVSTGSSKSGFLGEASIDFADFAAETEALTVSLPLKFANSGAVLHVTIEKMQGATDQRDIEVNGNTTLPQLNGSNNSQSNDNIDGKQQNFADGWLNVTATQNAEQIGRLRASSGSGTTLASIWDASPEQNDQQGIGFKNNTIREDTGSFQTSLIQNSMPQRGTIGPMTTKKHEHRRSSTEWSVGSVSEGSLADSTTSPGNNLPSEWQEASDGSVEKLKQEIASMMRQAEISELELQSLRKQIVKESKRAQDQSRQIISLTEERDALKTECKQLRRKNCIDEEVESQLKSENEHLKVVQGEIKKELNHEKELNSNFRLQLQKIQDSNSELILAVEDLNEMLEQKNREISSLSSKIETSKFVGDVQAINDKGNISEDEHQLAFEELIKEHEKEVEILKQEVRDQCAELEFYKEHSEELELHVKQLTQDCEVLEQENQCLSSKLEQSHLEESMKTNECLELLSTIKELESQIDGLEDKIKQHSEEYSESLIFINELEGQVKELKRELEKRAQEFEDDLDAVTRAKTEQEQRAIRAEEALRKTRWKNAITAERLQEEIKRLSVEMASKFDDNEKIAIKALTEANELRMQIRMLEEKLQKAKDELGLIKDQNEVKLQELSSEIDLREKQIEKMSLELDHKSNQLENAQKSEVQNNEVFSMEIQMLRTEIDELQRKKYNSSEHVEGNSKLRHDAEQIVPKGETDMLIQSWNKEKNDLENKFALAKKEAEKAHEELIYMTSLKDEKEMNIGKLRSEVENLRVQHKELKNMLIEEQFEKENLRKQVFQLKNELQKKVRVPPPDEYKHTIRKDETYSNEGPNPTSYSNDVSNLTELLSEVTLLKEKNISMENELKEMQERYSEISLKFAEVEGERQQLVMTVRNLKNCKKNESPKMQELDAESPWMKRLNSLCSTSG